MTTIELLAGFPYSELKFNIRGVARSQKPLRTLIGYWKRHRITDVVFLAHGFRCSASDATSLYMRLLATLGVNLNRPEFAAGMAGRKFAVAGVYWKSEEYRESSLTSGAIHDSLDLLREHCATPHCAAALDRAKGLLDAARISRHAQDEFVASVFEACDDGSNDPAEGLPLLRGMEGSELLGALQSHAIRQSDGAQHIPLVSPLNGGIGAFLNFMKWSAMKKLSGEVGANGLANAVLISRRALAPSVRIHLVGHSLGGRLVAACCKALGQRGEAKIDSLSLLEGAFSHFGFSPDAGSGQPGFFREVMDRQVVSGPMISTFSKADRVLHAAYAVASRLCRDRLQSIGGPSDPYGGIGYNGAQRTPESAIAGLNRAGQPYRFQSRIVTCLDGSPGRPCAQPDPSGRRRGGVITGHDDVTNTHVTYAVASAIL